MHPNDRNQEATEWKGAVESIIYTNLYILVYISIYCNFESPPPIRGRVANIIESPDSVI